jgi:hypothetical protein
MPRTEITLVGGERRRVEGEPKEVEAAILSAARGSLMEFAWMTDADSGEQMAINPDHVQVIQVLASGQ